MEERRSKERAPGATDEASAALMGHSTAAWDKAYDLRCGLRESEKAIEGCTVWRQAMLAKCQEEGDHQGPANVMAL